MIAQEQHAVEMYESGAFVGSQDKLAGMRRPNDSQLQHGQERA